MSCEDSNAVQSNFIYRQKKNNLINIFETYI